MDVKEQAYEDHKQGMTYKDIANKYGVSLSTVKSWAYRYWKSWERLRNESATKKKKVATKHRKGGQPKNQNAAKHGLFAKYLPEETAELVETVEQQSPLDILWENICLKYAAIIRAQRIMFVRNADDVTKRQTMAGDVDTYEYKEAYEKQAVFLQAQSRAMGTLNNMIRQYEEMCRQGQADEEQQLRIAKLKAEVAERNTDKQAETVTFTFDRKGAHTDRS